MERGRRLDVAWEEVASSVRPEDRAWVQEAVFGTVRLQGRLDHLLDLHLDRGIGSLAGPLLPVLRLGAYQLLYMDGVPDYAAVSQTVEQARERVGPRVAGLVNAVLRGLLREGGGVERFPSLDADPEGHLSSWGSHPRWLVRRWLGRYGVEAARRIVEADNAVPPLYLKPLATGEAPDGSRSADRGALQASAIGRLAEEGIRAEPGPEGTGTLRLAPGSSPVRALGAVPGIVQDPGAAWVVEWVGPVRGMRAVDLCAAPGGKAVGLAAAGARVVAADRSVRRIRRVSETAARLGLNLPRVVADASTPPFRPVEMVLVDVPCSGTGTLARHPDARWRLSPDDIDALVEVQDRILDGAAGAVQPGGLLVYSTCTLEPEENEERVQAFLLRHPGFILEGAPASTEAPADGRFLRVLPHRTGTDGSFAARLRRRQTEGEGTEGGMSEVQTKHGGDGMNRVENTG